VSDIQRSCVCPSGLWPRAMLQTAANSNPFLSLPPRLEQGRARVKPHQCFAHHRPHRPRDRSSPTHLSLSLSLFFPFFFLLSTAEARLEQWALGGVFHPPFFPCSAIRRRWYMARFFFLFPLRQYHSFAAMADTLFFSPLASPVERPIR